MVAVKEPLPVADPADETRAATTPAPSSGRSSVDHASSGGYTLDNSWHKARRRVTLIEEMFDLGTTARLGSLGVAAGWRCLEVGAGAGSIARWLADRVGPTGSVTAVDIDPSLMAGDPRPNLIILRADVVADPLPGEGYDVIHARTLLMHLPNREELIGEFAARLRPGGVLLLEEGDFYPHETAEGTAYARLFGPACAMARTRGGDWLWARHLPARMAAAGLCEVEAVSEVRAFRAGTPMAEFYALSLEQVSPLLTADGTAPDLIDAVHRELTDPEVWLPSFAMVRATGRRPA